jgi:hypothetical protein
MKRVIPSRTNAEVADELESWATDRDDPDVLSMTETVADYWRQIVAALREKGDRMNGPF